MSKSIIILSKFIHFHVFMFINGSCARFEIMIKRFRKLSVRLVTNLFWVTKKVASSFFINLTDFIIREICF